MKTASIPPLRVDQALRDSALSVLRDGESLSSFVELSLRAGIERRRTQGEFIARGLAARDEAKLSGNYHWADQVVAELDEMLRLAEGGADNGRGEMVP